jgi:uncharacterized protein YuzE
MQNDLPVGTSQRLRELTARIQLSDQIVEPLSEILGCLTDSLDGSLVASRLYTMWAELSDFYDLRSDQRVNAVTLIRGAARDWSQVAAGNMGCEEYLAHWNTELDHAHELAGKPPLLVALEPWRRSSRHIDVAFDPEADAVYVKLDENDGRGGETHVTDNGVVVDTDAGEHVRGLEFLNVRTRGLPTDEFPAFIRRTLELFQESGALTSDVPVRRRYE